MESTEHDSFLQKVVRLQRLIFLALILGVCLIGTILIALHFTAFKAKGVMPDPPMVGDVPILTVLAGIVACGALVGSFVMPNVMRKQIVDRLAAMPPQNEATTRSALLTGWQGGNLIRAGLLEGPLILSLILFLVTGDYALLAIAGVLLVLLIANMPGEASARRWLDAAEDELATKRVGG